MAIQIEWRNSTAASWTSTNPILAEGEKGVETDTGQFKIGDGTSTWSSLSYQGTTGPYQTFPFKSFGDGSDGNVTISSGTTTLSRDMYYNNLTLSGTGILNTSGYKVFVKGNLDITAAQAGAIQWNGTAGGNASGATGGTQAAAQSGGTLGSINQGSVGVTATTGSGANGTASANNAGMNSGASGGGGNGGTGSTIGGTGAASRNPNVNNPFSRYETSFFYGSTLMTGGPGGASGGAGSGDGTNTGGGSGAGGNGGGIVALFVNAIIKSSSTPSGVIQANGGNGGNGGNSSAGVSGGGGGGGGGAGGWVYLAYNYVFGPTITALIQANSGNGGNGGSGFGTGTGGNGGNAGTGGRVNIFNVPTGASQNLVGGVDNSIFSPELIGSTFIATSSSLELPGGNGGFNGVLSVSL